MFGILLDLSTLLVSICGFLMILIIVIPNLAKLKKQYWFIIKSLLIISLAVMIILFAINGEDLFFYLGSIIGISSILRASLLQSKNRSLLLSFAFISFSFIFLSFNQKTMFYATLVFSYILFLSVGIYSLFQEQTIKDKKTLKITLDFFLNLMILGLMIIPLILIVNILFSSSAGFFNIWIFGDSLIDVFGKNHNLIIFSIIMLVFLVIISIYLILEIKSNNQKRAEESWYT